MGWLLSGGLGVLIGDVAAHGLSAALGTEPVSMLWWGVVGIFGPLPPMAFLTTYAVHTVICDCLEGRYTPPADAPATPVETGKATSEEAAASSDVVCKKLVPVAPHIQGSVRASPGACIAALTFKERVGLWLQIQSDMANMAELTIMAFGMAPVCLAAWSLMWNGTRFDY